jgi:hypothetical protein
MDLASLLCVIRVTERHLLLLIRGLLLAVSVVFTVSTILAIPINRVNLSVVLLLLHRPLATRLKKLSLGFESLDTCVCDCEQIDYRLGLFLSPPHY